MKKTIKDFSGTKMSGLLKQFFTQLDNGGLEAIHLDLILNRQNPWDTVLYAFWENKYFYRDVFNMGIEHHLFKLPENYDAQLSYLTVILSEERLPLERILEAWSTYTGKEIETSNYGYKYMDRLELQPSAKEDTGQKVAKWGPGLLTGEGIKLSHNDYFTIVDGTVELLQRSCGLTLREGLLRLMFLFWKYDRLDCFANTINKDRKPSKENLSTYLIPCYKTLYTRQPDTDDRVSYPLIIVQNYESIRIRPSAYRTTNLVGIPCIEIL